MSRKTAGAAQRDNQRGDDMFEDLVKLHEGQERHPIEISGLQRELPIRWVGDGMGIASNAQLVFGCDVEFTKCVGGKLASRLRPFRPECLLTVEVKSLCIAYETAHDLGHSEFAIVRKSSKAYMKSYIVEKVKSITTKEIQHLVLDEVNMNRIRGKRISIVDDVISTGGTMDGMLNLAQRVDAKICAIGTVWLEGPWPWRKYRDWILSRKLVYLGVLPIFVSREKRIKLLKEVESLRTLYGARARTMTPHSTY